MDGQRILMGMVGRPHGVRGLVRVHSYATVPADLVSYGTLTDERGAAWTLRWRGEGIAELTDASGHVVQDRDAAAALVNRKLFVERDRLPAPDEDEFYLADLVGAGCRSSVSATSNGRSARCWRCMITAPVPASRSAKPVAAPCYPSPVPACRWWRSRRGGSSW